MQHMNQVRFRYKVKNIQLLSVICVVSVQSLHVVLSLKPRERRLNKRKSSAGSFPKIQPQRNYMAICLLMNKMDSNVRINQHRSRSGSNDRGRRKQEKNDVDAFMRLVGFLTPPKYAKC